MLYWAVAVKQNFDKIILNSLDIETAFKQENPKQDYLQSAQMKETLLPEWFLSQNSLLSEGIVVLVSPKPRIARCMVTHHLYGIEVCSVK